MQFNLGNQFAFLVVHSAEHKWKKWVLGVVCASITESICDRSAQGVHCKQGVLHLGPFTWPNVLLFTTSPANWLIRLSEVG